MKHHFRRKLLNENRLIGTMVTLDSPAVSELLAQVGFDWLFIDAEHAPFSTRDMQALLQSAGNTPCVIRLVSGTEVAIKKALDIGAAGIIVPQVNTAEHAEQIIRMARYSPEGNRGVGIGRAHGYGLKFQEYIDRANEKTAVIVQAEHIEAVNNIHSIVKVPGIDAVLVGPYDLSASLGKLGKVDDPEVVAAIEKVTEACLNAGIRLGIFGVTTEAVKPYIEKGYTLIVAGVDTLMLARTAKALLKELKNK
ncbi:2,4-dihydroxyhept-2-ene-1,7-dioic acid aldolase [candidate division KSB1 bacterium]|nr:2,4-dihydroxyhept-2-ene-1,7-dioic acid aldolase [candidate division KSB1 bacterium]MBL7092963.1 2,4-dihydroxyhept-2-ene-1,7-dioic acid aldolase [candidate division KSB1 bacterium]